MLGAFRATRTLLDGRNLFTKKVKMTQTRKRNSRKRVKIIQENAAIIREGREALAAVNARLAAATESLAQAQPAPPQRAASTAHD